jgi:anti-sigma regulatory factor (Ser/Thr protein kinase)
MLERHWTMAALNVAPGAARRAVHDFCQYVGLPEDRIHEVVLCVSEAVTNVVLHAYEDEPEEGTVAIDAHVDEHLCIHVRDTGGGLRPRPENQAGGLGLPIISQLAHSLELRTHDRGGTEVVMKFALP